MNIHADLPRIPKTRGKKNRPGDAAWKQQKLRAYRPLLTFRCALPITTVLSMILIAGGVLLYESALSAQEGVIDYTDCLDNNGTEIINMAPSPYNSNNPLLHKLLERAEDEEEKNVCVYSLYLNKSFAGNVTFYYGLTGYFQNLRQYFRSRNDEQLLGVHLDAVQDCGPYDYSNNTGKKLPIVPCGAVANSLFNDTFKLLDETGTPVPWTSKGILADSIRKKKFKNPILKPGQALCDAFGDNEITSKPKNWNKSICELGEGDGNDTGMGLENFDLIQWMTASALPDFRKVYRRLDIDADETYKDGLPADYKVDTYGSSKKFIIAVEGWLGPKNYFISFGIFAVFAFKN